MRFLTSLCEPGSTAMLSDDGTRLLLNVLQLNFTKLPGSGHSVLERHAPVCFHFSLHLLQPQEYYSGSQMPGRCLL